MGAASINTVESSLLCFRRPPRAGWLALGPDQTQRGWCLFVLNHWWPLSSFLYWPWTAAPGSGSHFKEWSVCLRMRECGWVDGCAHEGTCVEIVRPAWDKCLVTIFLLCLLTSPSVRFGFSLAWNRVGMICPPPLPRPTPPPPSGSSIVTVTNTYL